MWTSRSLTTVEGTKDGKVQGWWLLLWSPGGMYLWPGQQATIVIIKHWSLEWCGKCDVNLGRIRDPSYWNFGTMDGFQIHNQLISWLAFFLFFTMQSPYADGLNQCRIYYYCLKVTSTCLFIDFGAWLYCCNVFCCVFVAGQYQTRGRE